MKPPQGLLAGVSRGSCKVYGLARSAGGGRIQLLRGNHAGGTLRVLVLEGGVDLLGELRLVFSLVEISELELRGSGGDRCAWMRGKVVVQVDGHLVAAGLAVELREGQFGQGGEIAVPSRDHLLEGALSGGVVAGFHVSETGEVTGELAAGGQSVSVSGLKEELIGSLCAIGGGGKGFDARGDLLTGSSERRLVGLHGFAEGDGRLVAAALIDDSGDGNDDDDRRGDGSGEKDGAAMLAGPFEAMLGGIDELVVLECLAGLLIHFGLIFLR